MFSKTPENSPNEAGRRCVGVVEGAGQMKLAAGAYLIAPAAAKCLAQFSLHFSVIGPGAGFTFQL